METLLTAIARLGPLPVLGLLLAFYTGGFLLGSLILRAILRCVDTLAGLQAEFEGAFHLVFRVVELLGRSEHGELASGDAALLRFLTPIMKLTSARQAVAVTSEVVESSGGVLMACWRPGRGRAAGDEM